MNDETRMGLYFPLVMQRSGLCGDSTTAVIVCIAHHHPLVHQQRVIRLYL